MFKSASQSPRQASTIKRELRRASGIFVIVGLFSGVINLLALTGSFYMLQIYDRVLPSSSVPTLVGLTVLLAGLYVIFGLLDVVRVRIMARVGVRIDNGLRARVLQAVRLLPLRVRVPNDGLQPVRDLDQIRSFLSGMGPTAFFDMPWVPIYLGIIFLLHPALGLFALFGALILICLTFLTEYRTAAPMSAAAKSGAKRMALAEETRRNAEVIQALGLGPRMLERWERINAHYLAGQLAATDASSGIGTVSKVLRLFLQSGILGLGAYLVIAGKVSPGTIIAGSIIMSRALAPIETAISHWRSFVAARQSRQRLEELFSLLEDDTASRLTLPTPEKSLVVHDLAVGPPGAMRPTIHNIGFQLQAGEALGIIGPSGSGKSTLARALVGVWPSMRADGAVRLDGAALDQWSPEDLGRHIGYLPQDVALFEGTVAENIARFDPDATSEAIVTAAKVAGVHEIIVQLSDGYETRLGDGGSGLSAGQRQRIALARALYGNPFLVVLDEPNSNLDAAGDLALTDAIRSVRERGGIAIVIAHRPSALAAVNKVLAMSRGTIQALGPKNEVLKQVLQTVPNQAGTAPVSSAAVPGGSAASARPGPAATSTVQAVLPPGFAAAGLKIVADRGSEGSP
jgi:ATP-binding cassette subfamily C protein